MFFNDSRSCTDPMSLKTVGHGFVALHGAGEVTFVMTAESKVPPNWVGLLPGAACRLAITRNTADLSLRTTSPHEAVAVMSAANPRNLRAFRILRILSSSAFDNLRRNEDEQLGALIVQRVPLEQPAKQRHPAEPRRTIVRHLLLTDVDAPDHRCLAVADQHCRVRALCVDGRNAVDRAAEVRLRVLQRDLHDDGAG